MVGTIVGAAIQGASAIGGAIASSQANKKMMQLIGDEEERNRKWYDLEMSKDWMQRPEAQNAHPIRQPAWEEMHTEFPCLYFINTLSIRLPSWSRKRNFMVPSRPET